MVFSISSRILLLSEIFLDNRRRGWLSRAHDILLALDFHRWMGLGGNEHIDKTKFRIK
jgi:hypothetical protein